MENCITLRQETVWKHRLLTLNAIIDDLPSLMMLDDRFTINKEASGTLFRIPRINMNFLEISPSHQIVLTTSGDVEAGRLVPPARSEFLMNDSRNECYVDNWDDCIEVEAGYLFSVGLKNDGTVYKSYREGALFGSDSEGICAMAADNFLVLLRQDGTVDFDGLPEGNKHGTDTWRECIEVASGGYRVMGLRADGKVYCSSKDGRCDGHHVDKWNGIVSIAAGAHHVVGLKGDGTLITAGSNEHGQCNVTEWADIVAIAAFKDVTLGLKKDGSVIRTFDNKVCSGKTMVNFSRDQVIKILGAPII